MGTKQARGCTHGRAGFYVTLMHSGASRWENCPSPSSSVQEPPANQLKGHTDPTQADCRTSLGAKTLSITNSLSSSAALPFILTTKGTSSTARKGLLTSLLHLHTRKMVLKTLLFKLPVPWAVSAIQSGDPAAPVSVRWCRGLLLFVSALNPPPCQHKQSHSLPAST